MYHQGPETDCEYHDFDFACRFCCHAKSEDVHDKTRSNFNVYCQENRRRLQILSAVLAPPTAFKVRTFFEISGIHGNFADSSRIGKRIIS